MSKEGSWEDVVGGRKVRVDVVEYREGSNTSSDDGGSNAGPNKLEGLSARVANRLRKSK